MTKEQLVDKLRREATEARKREIEDNDEYQKGKAVAYENSIKYIQKLEEPKIEEYEIKELLEK